jgi:hypothetical protein
MPQKPLPLIISLKHWREQNGFSQSDAVRVLKKAGIRPSKNIRVTRGKVALRVASCSDRILFDRQPLIHVEPKSPVGSHVRVDKRRQCT